MGVCVCVCVVCVRGGGWMSVNALPQSMTLSIYPAHLSDVFAKVVVYLL